MGGTSGYILLERVVSEVINPLIYLIFTGGLFLFMWGVAVFVFNLSDESKRTTGKKHMLWGIVGMFIMVATWGIIQLVADTVGVDLADPTMPSASGGAASFPVLR